MANSCVLCPKVKNSRGNLVDSKFYISLEQLSLGNERTRFLYNLGNDRQFQNTFSDDLRYDDLGQPTIDSFKHVYTQYSIDEDILNVDNLAVLGKVYNRLHGTFEDGLQEIEMFERIYNPLDDDTKYILIPVEGQGNYAIGTKVVEKSDQTLSQLREGKRAIALYQQLQDIFNTLGYTSKTLESLNFLQVLNVHRYGIASQLKNASPELITCLFDIIRSKYGDNQIERAKEIFNVTTDSELVSSLLNYIYDPSTSNKTKYIVIDNFIQNLEEFYDAIYKASRGDSLEEAQDATVTEKEVAVAKNIYRNILSELSHLVSDLIHVADKSSDIVKGSQNLLKELTKAEEAPANTSQLFQEGAYLQAILESLQQLLITFEGATKKDASFIQIALQDINFEPNKLNFLEEFADKATKVRQTRLYLARMAAIRDALKSVQFEGNNDIIKNIKAILDQLQKAIANGLDIVEEAERNIFLTALQNLTGCSKIKIAAHRIWGSSKTFFTTRLARHLNKEGKLKKQGVFTSAVKDYEISYEEMIHKQIQDESIWTRWFASMSRSKDVINQALDKIVKQQQAEADRQTLHVWEQLNELQKEYKRFGFGDIGRSMYETYEQDIYDEEGNIIAKKGDRSGNLLCEYNYGQLEIEEEAFKTRCIKKFREDNPDLVESDMSELYKSLKWEEFYFPLLRTWRNKHYHKAQKGQLESQRIPLEKYKSARYAQLAATRPEVIKWLDKYKKLKAEIDSLLDIDGVQAERAPQFLADIATQTRNIAENHNSAYAYITSLRVAIQNNWYLNAEDYEFGDPTKEWDKKKLFFKRTAYEKSQDIIAHIPLYGIRKIKDPSKLTADLFGSTLAYASMAYSYNIMKTVADIAETGKEVLLKRKTFKSDWDQAEGGESTTTKNDYTRCYARYLDYINANIYHLLDNQANPTKAWIAFKKAIRNLTSAARVLFLGGNVAGGVLNLFTGCNELLKESITGEFFSMKDLLWADAQYMGRAPISAICSINSCPTDFLSCFVRHFNTIGNTRQRFRSWSNTKENPIVRSVKNSIMLPYSIGDHYLQTTVYLAYAHNIKLWNRRGAKFNLLETYKTTKIGDIEQQDIFFTDKDNIVQYYNCAELIKYLNAVNIGEEATIPSDDTLASLQKYIAERYDIFIDINSLKSINNESLRYKDKSKTQSRRGVAGNNIAEIIPILKKAQNDLTWTEENEVEYMDHCREISNMMQGIYNSYDKTAFGARWYGEALLSMRKFILGMVNARFASSNYVTVLQADSSDVMKSASMPEGYYNTAAKVFFSTPLAANEIGRYLGNILSSFILPWSSIAQNSLRKEGFSESQIYNMKRLQVNTFLFFIIQIASFVLRCIYLTNFAGNDDDKEQKEKYANMQKVNIKNIMANPRIASKLTEAEKAPAWLNLLYYIVLRGRLEQTILNPTILAYDIATQNELYSVYNISPAFVDGTRELAKLMKCIANPKHFDDLTVDEVKEAIKEVEANTPPSSAGPGEKKLPSKSLPEKELPEPGEKQLSEQEKKIKELQNALTKLKRLDEATYNQFKDYYYINNTNSHYTGESRTRTFIYNKIPYLRSRKQLKNGPGAYESYEYGIAVRR